MKKNYDLSALMTLAWEIYRKSVNKCVDFADALKRAWACFDEADYNRMILEDAIASFDINEEAHTWYGWVRRGRKVMHDEKATFHVIFKNSERGIGKTFNTAFFTFSQTDYIENVA